MRIPFGYELRVYRQDGQSGMTEGVDFITMHGWAYEDATQEPYCQNMPAGWTDVDRSITVQKVGQAGSGAVGHWRNVKTVTEGTYYKITLGMTSAAEEETTKQEQFALKRDMESSITYEIGTASS